MMKRKKFYNSFGRGWLLNTHGSDKNNYKRLGSPGVLETHDDSLITRTEIVMTLEIFFKFRYNSVQITFFSDHNAKF
jgi:hypothetical protein